MSRAVNVVINQSQQQFPSVLKASQALGVSTPTVKKRVESDLEKWCDWYYITHDVCPTSEEIDNER